MQQKQCRDDETQYVPLEQYQNYVHIQFIHRAETIASYAVMSMPF